DGDGDFTFVSAQTTAMLSVDLDGNNSTATGTAYQATYVENAAAIPVVDSDVSIAQNGALGTTLGQARVVLTNAQASDVLSVGALPAGIVATVDTSVGGQITVTLSGSSTVADYQAALAAIRFENTSQSPSTVDRQISVEVTNTLFGTTSAVALSTIHVTPVNEAPAGTDGTITTSEDTAYTLTATDFGFSDIDGNALRDVKIASLPASGSLSYDGTPLTAAQIAAGYFISAADIASGKLQFIPDADTSGAAYANISFQVRDDGGISHGGVDLDQTLNTISFNVTAVNDAPVAVNDGTFTVAPGTNSNIAVLINDSDVDGGTLSLSQINGTVVAVGGTATLATGTTVTRNADGTLGVVMAPGSNSTETFTYVISDGNGGTATATVTLARDTDADGVANSADIDDDNDGILDIVEESPGQLDLADFSGWTVGSRTGTVAMPNGGTVAINTAVSYAPGAYVAVAGYPKGTTAPELAAFVGQVEFDAAFPEGLSGPTSGLTVWTGTAAASPVTHVMSVDFTNTTAGVANKYSVIGISGIYPDYLTVYDAKVTFTAIKADGSIETDYSGWEATNPNPGFTGTDANGAILDTDLESAVATPTGFVLDPANISTYTGNQDLVPVLIKLPEGSAYKTIIITREKLGSGSDFEYLTLYVGEHTLPPDTDSDGLVDALDIDSDNDGILDNIEAQSTAGYIAPSGVGAGITDANNDGLDDVYDAGALGAAGGIGLTPVNTDGTDKADWRDLDSDNDLKLDLTERGDGQPTLVTSATDADSDGLLDIFEGADVNDGFVVNDENRTQSTLNLAASPVVAADGSNAVPMTRDLFFRSINNLPVTIDDTFSSNEGTVSAPLVLAGNDADPDLDVLSVLSINGVVLTPGIAQSISIPDGTVNIDPAGVITFTGSPGYSGPVMFSYVVSDAQGGTDVGNVSGTVVPVNDAPVNTLPASYNAVVGTPLAITGLSIADIDAAGAPVSVNLGTDKGILTLLTMVPGGLTAAQISGNGTSAITINAPLAAINATLGATNGIVFTALPGDFGTASLGILTNDLGNTGLGGPKFDLDSALINIDRLPIADADTASTDEDAPVIIDVLANDSDPDGNNIVVSSINGTQIVVGTPIGIANGTVTPNADGTLTFTPTANYNGPASFNYTISDGLGGTATASVAIVVVPVNDPPTLDLDNGSPGTGLTGSYVEGEAGVPIGALLNNITDIDSANMASATIVLTNVQPGDLLTAGTLPGGIVASSYDAATGTMTLTGSASKADYQAALHLITFSSTGDSPASVTRAIAVTVNDGVANSNAAIATISVTVVNDAPVNGLPASFTAAATTTVNLAGLSITDPDAASGSMTVTFAVGSGSLILDATVMGGISAAQVTGNGTALITITAPVAAINSTLASSHGLDFVAPAGAVPVTFAMQTSDNGNTGSGGALADFDVRTIFALPAPPSIDLDLDNSSGATGGNYLSSYVENAPGAAITDSDFVISDAGVPYALLAMSISGVVDGSNEQLTIAGASFDLSQSSVQTVELNSGSAQIIYDALAHTFSVVNAAGGSTSLTNADVTELLTSARYLDAGEVPTPGDRVLTFVLTNTSGQVTSAVSATLAVIEVNDAPVVIDPANPGTAANPIAATDPLGIIPDVATTDGATPAAVNVGAYIVDPDGEALSFTATGLPPGM
ncbi:MAG: Ig-like domain-containing protein, partial [Hyphomicrobium sp.]